MLRVDVTVDSVVINLIIHYRMPFWYGLETFS